ncbi:unnamed protein product [Nyctereutes procyonoides]|uniref:(raccoon dog) hypothetical protein n=1 Tax=Nyctereutes procyonoides TaxID=34880 RepID=A0A811Y0L7_NYCPR|nr:unnamed protein product [Nyctereutes procyonoides]
MPRGLQHSSHLPDQTAVCGELSPRCSSSYSDSRNLEASLPLQQFCPMSLLSKVVVTPVPLQGRLPEARTPSSQCHSQDQPLGPTGQSTLCGKGSAKRSILSATKMNVRFSAATKDNEHKRSLTKTPARKSPHVTICGSTPKGKAVLGTCKLKTAKGNSASPHKGKLKPWGQPKENSSSLKQHANRVSFHKKTYKQPPLQTREEQRKQHEQRRRRRKQRFWELEEASLWLKIIFLASCKYYFILNPFFNVNIFLSSSFESRLPSAVCCSLSV